MASASDIEAVRLYAGVTENAPPFSDTDIGSLIDSLGVAGATAEVLRRYIPALDALVDTTEAGASHKLSLISDKARKRLEYWENQGDTPGVANASTVRVKKIVRS